MYILIHNSNGPFAIKLNDSFIQVNIDNFYSIKETDDYLYKSNQEEFFLNAISESLDNSIYNEVTGIIIDKNLGGSGWSRAIGLAGHIACTEFSKSALNTLPIILTDWTDIDLEDPSIKDTIINNIFQTKGFYFRKYEAIFSLKSDKISGQTSHAIDLEVKKLKSIEIEKINISSRFDTRHQTTNEWGAMRLASNFGVFELIKFTYPKHLYFKYLTNFLKKNQSPPDKSLHSLFNKILLIDDNADCGWKELLENIHNCTVDKRISTVEVLAWQTSAPEKFDQYDLIYLDLYLEKGKADSKSALSALRFIKANFPHIPVIIFTASDKAWNLEEVLDKGADAMYTKESPLYYNNVEYSSKNFREFTNTVKYVYEKYKKLKPYSIQIRNIFSHSFFILIENSPRKLRERIEERLKMFYGLLKKGYEQREYDKKTFFYSDFELAFITLWSVLNEIQEYYFIKTQLTFPVQDSNGTFYKNHPNSYLKIRTDLERWIYSIDQSSYIDFYVEIALDGNPIETINSQSQLKSGYFDFKFYSNFKQITIKDPLKNEWIDHAPFFELVSAFQNHKQLKIYQEKIVLQIAYIVEKLNPSNKLHFYSSLVKLNKIRNSLYLTHGNNIEPTFFLSTERQKRTNKTLTSENEIKDLFNLVSLLLTTEENFQIAT